MYARSTTVLAHLESIDEGIANVRDEVMPWSRWTAASGCRCSPTGIPAGASSRRPGGPRRRCTPARGVRASRERAAQIFGEMPTVAEWEIAVMHRDHTSGPGACVRASVAADGAPSRPTASSTSTGWRCCRWYLVPGGQEAVEGYADVERGSGRCGARGVRCLDAGSRLLGDDNAVADQAAPVTALEHEPRVRAGGAPPRTAGPAAEISPDLPAGQEPAGFGDLIQHRRVGPIVPFVGVPDEDDCCHLPIVTETAAVSPNRRRHGRTGPVGPVWQVALRVSSAMDSIWCRMWVSEGRSGSGG